MKLEEAIVKFEPMISSCMRKLRIYKNHDRFRQAGLIGLWMALEKYDESKGELQSYAYRLIYGSMLDELKKETSKESLWETDTLTSLMDSNQRLTYHNEKLCTALEKLKPHEQLLIALLYRDRYSFEEVSKQLNITISGAKKRRVRILRKLREILEQDRINSDDVS